jgi:upstream activation factor subunit UAF30
MPRTNEPKTPRAPKMTSDASVNMAPQVQAQAPQEVQPTTTQAQPTASRKPRAPKNVKVSSSAQVVAEPTMEVAPVSVMPSEQSSEMAQTTPAVVAESQDDGLANAFSEAFSKLQQMTTMLSALKTEFRQLEKRTARELKVANKASSKRRRKSGNRSPSGFVKPTLISTELANFLGKVVGTEMARTEVTREINAYIRKHSLQDKTNGRKINPDNNLSTLLKIKENEELTYFNLQRYMSPHFAKSVKTEQVAATVAK